MSAKAGWYPDPGGGRNLYRYWDGKVWSAATSPNPTAAPPTQGIGSPTPPPQPTPAAFGAGGYGATTGGYPGQSLGGQPLGGQPFGGQPLGGQSFSGGGSNPYQNFQQVQTKKSAAGWWIGGAALLIVIVVIAVFSIRAISNGTLSGTPGGGQASSDVCPPQSSTPDSPLPHAADGRVHGGPVSYPQLGSPWDSPTGDNRVPFGRDVQTQTVTIEANYQPNSSWVASVLVGELQAGDGFFTPEQGSQIVVKCILGRFYGDNPVKSDVKVNKAMQIDGHDGWLVESHLTFDIAGLKTKGETLIVAIVNTQDASGLYYASIPDTSPQLLPDAREALAQLTVDS